VSPHDCTGCELCVHACPDAALVSTPIKEALPIEATNWDFFKTLPNRWVCSGCKLCGGPLILL
jgi:pyruvate-ferredoxin/flavodoxin oxidoreductase